MSEKKPHPQPQPSRRDRGLDERSYIPPKRPSAPPPAPQQPKDSKK